MSAPSSQQPVRRVSSPPAERPLMVWDGECRFCARWVERWRDSTGDRIDYRTLQEAAPRFPEIPRADFEGAVQLIEPDGRVTGGADAVFRALDFSPKKKRVLGLLRALPGFDGLARRAYRFIARHRMLFSALTSLLWGSVAKRSTYFFARWLYLRLLGLIYLIAFVSLAAQIRELIGQRGILPAQPYLDALEPRLGAKRFWLLPTICWFSATDDFLMLLCILGAAVSVALMAGFWPSLCLFVLWAFYLSLVVVGREFLGFQWDALLLEAGFLSMLMVPALEIFPRWKTETFVSRIGRWLVLWLAFRLTFESGLVKLTYNDPTWWNLTALTYHYQTQPLPLWTAWYANQLPLWFQKFSCAIMFAIELGAPWLIFGPRRLRQLGFGATALLQGLIAATGNYNFFNLLTVALYVPLLDDHFWPRRWLRVLGDRPAPPHPAAQTWVHAGILAPVAAVSLFMSAVQLLSSFRPRMDWPDLVAKYYGLVSRWQTFNGYGLFRVMTTERPEIVIEGSNDSETWLAYEFKWKPGDMYRAPGLCEPHQPRLDWQMWFAALNPRGDVDVWVLAFLQRLLEGSPEVLGLMEHNPFPGAPPRYVRAVLYDYKFTRFEDHTKAWWKREYQRLYCPPVSLESFR
jgi:predicted DCC family thiol-disulfide oxidoreductase YuxK